MHFIRIFRPMPAALTYTIAVGAVALSFTVRGAGTATAAPAASTPRASASTNALPPIPEVRKSVFVVPATSQEGKDPFFPQSTRLHPVIHVAGTKAPSALPELELKGISGTASHRLAIINNRTFESGEEGDVVCNGIRVRVKCLQIEPDGVQILVSGRERVLRLHTKF